MKMFGYELKKTAISTYDYKVGLALSGGGARGFAHCGAIQAMLEVGLKADIIAGVSAGSVVAVMHAAGIPPREMLDMFVELKFNDLAKWSMPKGGFFRLDKFKKFLRKNIPYKRLEQLPVPTVVCATDYRAGRKVAFSTGDLADCVAASCCVPIVFSPVMIKGVGYVDGGVLSNLPAWAIRNRCKFLVGVNCSPATSEDVPSDNVVRMAMRSYQLMSRNNMVTDMKMCDMLVNVDDVADYSVFDLKGITGVFDSGYNAACDYLASRGVVATNL
ncbi:MAG: patatin-like phospholipase family protein [Bacteroides sp.]|nr:patatin-like phospholipase family protein [Bacteroides sp.]MCM1413608.1 patatin-like phospholipase family protein [Bacteroides sp.]MCM1471175.1 patatin-like phospholipase family protein [Bacteroides sp.]